MFVIFGGISAGFAILFWVGFCYRAASFAKTVVKTVPMVALAIAAIIEGFSIWLVAGLLLSAIGDFALSRKGQGAFLAGLVAFAAAHLMYVGLFTAGLDSTVQDAPVWVFAVLGGVWIVVLFAVVPFAKRMIVPVLVYMILITAMVLTAARLGHREAGFLTGALLFALSDFILSIQLFRSLPKRFDIAASLAIWPLYYAGQAIIVLGVATLRF